MICHMLSLLRGRKKGKDENHYKRHIEHILNIDGKNVKRNVTVHHLNCSDTGEEGHKRKTAS